MTSTVTAQIDIGDLLDQITTEELRAELRHREEMEELARPSPVTDDEAELAAAYHMRLDIQSKDKG